MVPDGARHRADVFPRAGLIGLGDRALSVQRPNLVTMTKNTATDDQGGVIVNSEGTMNLKNCTISQNQALGDEGGAIENGEGSEMHIDGCTHGNNVAKDDEAGAITNESDLTINNSTFRNNISTGDGGAIDNDGPLTITNSYQ